MPNELKPCPFCGGRAIMLKTADVYNLPKFFVTCDSCGVEMPRIYKTREAAAEPWNRRADND